MHQRRIIRNAVVAHLLAGDTALGDRIFGSRDAPAAVEELLAEGPMANVYCRRDTAKDSDYPPSGQDGAVRRTLEVAIEITATGGSVVDDKLDDLADEVEKLMEGLEVPGLPATELRLMSTEVDSTDEFDTLLGGALLVYEATYWRPYRTNTEAEPHFTHAHTNGPGGVSLVATCPGFEE